MKKKTRERERERERERKAEVQLIYRIHDELKDDGLKTDDGELVSYVQIKMTFLIIKIKIKDEIIFVFKSRD